MQLASANSPNSVRAETQRVQYLDGWRAMAVLSVLFGHFVTTNGINLGRFGVELFFVLSGRLMAEILFIRNTPLTTFFPRRFSRVYPAMLFFAVAMLVIGIATGSGDPTLTQFLSTITLTANYAQLWTGHSLVLDHIWSLCIEEHMYILLGILALIHRRVPLPIAFFCFAIAVAAIINGIILTRDGGDYYSVYWRTDVRGASILIGCACYLFIHDRIGSDRRFSFAPIGLCVLAVCFNVHGIPDPIKYSLGTTCLALGLVTMPIAPQWVIRILSNPLLLRIGVWSYSIYLWQQPFAKEGGSILTRVAMLVLAITLALLSFYCVEQPVRNYLNRKLHTRRPKIEKSLV